MRKGKHRVDFRGSLEISEVMQEHSTSEKRVTVSLVPMRINRWLARLGLGSRREVEAWILEGRVKVNGVAIDSPGHLVYPTSDSIKLGRKLLPREEPRRSYWLLNKPTGCITSKSDPEGRPTIFDLESVSRLAGNIEPVGRLDFQTEGLLILTDDGDLANRLMHPRYQVSRRYDVLLKKPLTDSMKATLKKGLWIGDGMGKALKLEDGPRSRAMGYWYRVEVNEGRNRLVRRLFDAIRMKVARLKRVSYGPLWISKGLAIGAVQAIESAKVNQLLHEVGLSPLSTESKKRTVN